MKKTVLSIIFASLITATSVMMFTGCGNKETSTPDEATTTVATSAEMTTSPTTTVPAVTVPKAVKDLVDKGEIKVDKDGNITDKNGKKVEVKDGKVEVKTDDGKTVTVKVDDVKTTVSNKNSNKGNTEKKEDTKSNTSKKDNTSSNTKNDSSSSSNNQKPASKPSNSSNNKPASNTTATEAPKYKYYKHHDAVTKYHPAVTKKHDREWIVTGTHEEPVYVYDWVDVCNDCGQQLADANQRKTHLLWEVRENGGRGSYHAEKRQIQVGTKTVEDGYWKEAYTEVVSKAWTETIPAYDEEVSENDHWDKKVPIN